eukprot:GHVO01057049.1.p1 GENE.GHVO01057049.1~~GHVO01057049.1.p1  ORF type:complete len:825 (+),score=185.62 GHVO01057049.1:32-2476(+)
MSDSFRHRNDEKRSRKDESRRASAPPRSRHDRRSPPSRFDRREDLDRKRRRDDERESRDRRRRYSSPPPARRGSSSPPKPSGVTIPLGSSRAQKLNSLGLSGFLTDKIKIDEKAKTESTGIVFLKKKDRHILEVQRKEEMQNMEEMREVEARRKRKEFLLQEDNERERQRDERARERRRKELERRRHEEDTEHAKNKEGKQNDTLAVPSLVVSSESILGKLEMINITEPEMGAGTDRELDQIKKHYLGMKGEKKKIQKPSEKFRNIFNFEWDVAEDTARGDTNPLYKNKCEPQLLFGRGFRAGVDVREQRRTNDFYDQLVKRMHGNQKMAAIEGSAFRIPKGREFDECSSENTHWSAKDRLNMRDRDWRIFREDNDIYIKGGKVPPPIREWGEAELAPELLEAIKEVGYKTPTPIQMQAIPISLEQRDLIGIAETGSGKTAAYVLPLLMYVKSLPVLNDETSQDGPYCLVLAPSRELAIQIDEETRKFAKFCQRRTVCVVGGRNAENQGFELRRGAEIVIATPGRMKDVLERAFTVLTQCNYVVLDEADRMIDMGFEDVVNWILDQIPSTNLKSIDEDMVYKQEVESKAGHRKFRLTQMFSATMPLPLENLARKYLRFPAWISIGDPGAGKRSIEQHLEFISESKKKNRLQDVLQNADPPVMVFVNQKKVADILSKSLQKLGFRAQSLHGGKTQDVRESALVSFKAGETDILVATDVAGRGIDVEGVQVVINFDMPKDIESYTHRIGRTGRANKKGLSISFVTEDDAGLFHDLKQLLISTSNIVPMELSQHPASKAKPNQPHMDTSRPSQPKRI